MVPSTASNGRGTTPACSDFVLAGSPPNLGGELHVINSFTAVTKAKLWCRNQATIYCAFILHFERVAHECLHRPPLQTQNIYFSASWISRMLVRVLLILPKVCEVMLISGFPQFGWFGRLNASNRNWSA